MMVLLSLHGLSPAQVAALVEYDPGTVRRWIGRFNAAGVTGLQDRPRCGRPRLGGGGVPRRIAALLKRPGPWTVRRIFHHLGRPRLSRRTLYRRVRQVAIWRRPSWSPAAIRRVPRWWPRSSVGCGCCRPGR